MPAKPDGLLIAAQQLLQHRPQVIDFPVEAAVDIAQRTEDRHDGVGIRLDVVPFGYFGPATR